MKNKFYTYLIVLLSATTTLSVLNSFIIFRLYEEQKSETTRLNNTINTLNKINTEDAIKINQSIRAINKLIIIQDQVFKIIKKAKDEVH